VRAAPFDCGWRRKFNPTTVIFKHAPASGQNPPPDPDLAETHPG